MNLWIIMTWQNLSGRNVMEIGFLSKQNNNKKEEDTQEDIFTRGG